jgi:hypothetical protein
MGTKMPDEQDPGKKDESQDHSSAPAGFPLKPCGEVVLTHLDAPPPSGKQRIHPRRPAPPVPTREQRTGKLPAQDADSQDPVSE